MKKGATFGYFRGFKAAALILIVFAALSGCKKKGADTGAKLPPGEEIVIPFKLTTFDGRELNLDSFKGRPVVINFWASWCGPCRAEAGGLEKTYLSFRGDGVEFIGVAVDDSEVDARRFVEEFHLTFPTGLDSTGEIMKAYKLYGVPKTYVVGKDGRYTYIRTGMVAEEELAMEIRKAL